MDSRIDKLLAGVCLALVAVLLVGARLGFGWAGGSGYEPPETATVTSLSGTATVDAAGKILPLAKGMTLNRGEIIHAGDKAYVEIRLADKTRLALDERTDVTLEEMSKTSVAFRITRGRLITAHGSIKRSLIVRTNATEDTILAGSLSVIDYDFKQLVTIIPIKTPVGIMVKDGAAFVVATPKTLSEIPPNEVTPASFDPSTGAAAAFYKRFGIH